MTVDKLIELCEAKVLSNQSDLQKEVSGVYIGDLLSWVMGHGTTNQAWVTVQTHVNVIAVAALKEFACIIIADGAAVLEETIQRANEEGVILLQSGLSAYDIAKRIG